MTAWRVMPIDLMRIQFMNKWPKDNLFISNIKWAKEKLQIGDLYGNHFKLALRFSNTTNEEIKNSTHRYSFKDQNYFLLIKF